MEREILYKDALAGILSAKSEIRERAQRLSRHDRTILHIASKDGSVEQVEYILKEFANNNFLVKLDSNKETALHIAAIYGHTKVVEGLIEAAKKSLPTSADTDPHNPVNCFEAFVRHANESKNTALHLAVSNGNLGCAKLLVEADKGDRHIQNCNDETPVYLAAKLGYNDAVKMICVTCTTPTFDGPDGSTALHAAIKMLPQAKEEDRDVVKVLMDAARRTLSSHIKLEAFVRQSDKNMDTALHLAVLGKHLNVVEQILKEDLTYPHEDRNRDLKTPIYIAAEQGYKDIVKSLCGTLEFGYTTLGPHDRTALHAAIVGRDADCVKYILGRAPHLVTYGDNIGWTPLHYAAYRKFDSILDDIIEKQNSFGYQSVYVEVVTPLCLAVKEGHISTVRKLMESLPWSCSYADYRGQNILHIAACKGHKEMVQCILKCCTEEDADKILNDKDLQGNTPLHLLIRAGCFVPELINQADKSARNNQNWTPSDMLYAQEIIEADQTVAYVGNDRKIIRKILKEGEGYEKPSEGAVVKEQVIDELDKLVMTMKKGELQIKKALDAAQANHWRWKFWRRSGIKGKSNMQVSHIQGSRHRKMFWRKSIQVKSKTEESLVPASLRSRKEVEFRRKEVELRRAKKRLMKEELELYRQRTNTQIIVTALITTVTFTVGFTLPGGYHQSGEDDQGLALLTKKTAFKAFMVTDALALLLSTSSLFLYFISTMYQTPRKVSQLNAASTGLNIVSIIAMMLTFLMGTYMVLSDSPALATSVCVIVSLFFLLVTVLTIQMIYDRKIAKDEV